MLRVGCFLIVLTLACLAIGIYGLNESMANTSPTTLTYEQFVQRHPSEGWFIIKGCRVDLTESICQYSHFKSTETDTDSSDTNSSDGTPSQKGEWLSNIWLPVHGVNTPEGEKASLVLETMDPKIKQLVQEMRDMDTRDAKKAEVRKWVKAHISELVVERDLNGMIQAGILADEKTKSKLAEIDSELNSGYVILDDGRKPAGVGPSIGIIFFGVVLGAVTALMFYTRFFGRRDAHPPYNPGEYASAGPPTLYAPYSSQPSVYPSSSAPSTPPTTKDDVS